MSQQYHYPLSAPLYAQNCPEQPIIMSQLTPSPASSSSKPLPKKNRQRLVCYPRIISNHKLHNKFIESEHNRELISLNRRIRDCKSLTQRKKDHSDPIIYPAYFIRDKQTTKDARINSYLRQIQPRPKYKSKPSKEPKERIFHKKEPFQCRMALPDIQRRQSLLEEERLRLFVKELPLCDPYQVIEFIQRKSVYLDSDLLILKARMSHYFGENQVEPVWQQAMWGLHSN